jgi:diguanylate cyclase (GGDEF)-like protein/PAS domain S-box-containing protein
MYIFISALFCTTIISLLVAYQVWQRRSAPGRIYLTCLLAAVAEWSFCTALEALAIGQSAKLVWSKLEYLGSYSAAPFLLIFISQYIHQDKWLTRRNLALLWIIPVLTVLLAATNELHHLIWTGFVPGPEGSNLMIYQHGAWFWFSIVDIYIILFVGSFFLIRAMFQTSYLFHRQARAYLLAILAPWLAASLYLTGLTPIAGMDITPVGFMVTGVILASGISQGWLFDLVPVARDTLIESMGDCLLVVDDQNRIIDINPAARRLVGRTMEDCIGQPAKDTLRIWQNIAQYCESFEPVKAEVHLGMQNLYMDMHITPLFNQRKHLTGRLIIMRDITHSKQVEVDLQQVNHNLESRLVEIKSLQDQLREQATHDSLTGLYNRRFMAEILEKEISQALRNNLPVSLVMIDIDHFKGLNDNLGHKAGDEMLCKMCDLLATRCRKGDYVCRFGGEEFLVLMPGAPLEIGLQRAEEWRHGVEELPAPGDHPDLHITISLGAAVLPEDGKDSSTLLQAVDQALYKAKAAGRNCVCSAH